MDLQADSLADAPVAEHHTGLASGNPSRISLAPRQDAASSIVPE
jgi:hypothetical protein